MSMPRDLVLVRHGESEGNLATQAARQGDLRFHTDAFTTTPGHRWRQTATGKPAPRRSGRGCAASSRQPNRTAPGST